MGQKVLSVKISRIKRGTNFSRMKIDEEFMAGLMQSIKRDGVKQPVGISPLDKDKKHDYELVFGNSRVIACERLGMEEVPCLEQFLENPEDLVISNVVENLQRKNPDSLSVGRSYAHLRDKHGLTAHQIAVRIGISKLQVKSDLDLIDRCPDDIKVKICKTRNPKDRENNKIVPDGLAKDLLQELRVVGIAKSKINRLFEVVADTPSFSKLHVKAAVGLLKKGCTVENAVTRSTCTRKVSVSVILHIDEIARLEKKEQRKIGKVLHDKLTGTKKVQVEFQ